MSDMRRGNQRMESDDGMQMLSQDHLSEMQSARNHLLSILQGDGNVSWQRGDVRMTADEFIQLFPHDREQTGGKS